MPENSTTQCHLPSETMTVVAVSAATIVHSFIRHISKDRGKHPGKSFHFDCMGDPARTKG